MRFCHVMILLLQLMDKADELSFQFDHLCVHFQIRWGPGLCVPNPDFLVTCSDRLRTGPKNS